MDFAYDDPYALHLVIDFPDGRTQRWGPDELDAADVPTGLRFGTSMPGGYRDLACSLLRRIDFERYDEQCLVTVTVYDNAAEIVWRGRFRQFPRRHGEDFTVEPGAEGWIAHLSDRQDARALYRDVDLRKWGEPSVQRRINLIGLNYAVQSSDVVPDTTTGNASLACEIRDTWAAASQPNVNATYDAHGLDIGSIAYSWKKNATLPTGPDAWLWGILAATTDTVTVADDTGDLQAAGPGSGTLTVTDSGRKFAIAYLLFSGGAGGAANALYGLYWTHLAVMGRHGLTLRGTEPDAGYYVSDLVRHAVETWAPRLDTTDIEENTVVVTHAEWREQPTDAATMVQTFNRNALWDYGVYGRERFFFRQPNPDRLTWTLRMDLGTEMSFDGPTGDDLINVICVYYTDPSGRTRSVGPSECIVDIVSDTLRDRSASNPVNQAGLIKSEAIQLSDPVDDDTALLIGQLYLAERSVQQYRGQVVVTGMSAKHPTKGFRPAFEIKAGDYVQIVDSQDDVLGTVRKVVDTDYDHDERANTLDLDNRPDTVDALLSLLGAELVRVGL